MGYERIRKSSPGIGRKTSAIPLATVRVEYDEITLNTAASKHLISRPKERVYLEVFSDFSDDAMKVGIRKVGEEKRQDPDTFSLKARNWTLVLHSKELGRKIRLVTQSARDEKLFVSIITDPAPEDDMDLVIDFTSIVRREKVQRKKIK